MISTLASDSDLTRNAFLGGRLQIWQPRKGYRAGIDPVLLAAAVNAEPGQSVLDLGCGAGVAVLALARRVAGLDAAGLELQPDYAALARRNAAENGLPLEVIPGDLQAMPTGLRGRSFDHVIANPPYYDRNHGTTSGDASRETALGERLPLAAWIDAATRRLAPRGYLHVIQRADRLPRLLAACDGRLGGLRLLPLAPRAGRPAELVILRARKGARGAFGMLAPVVLHRGNRHQEDGESYTPEISGILRNGTQFTVDWR